MSKTKIHRYLGPIFAIVLTLIGVTSTPLAAQVTTATISGTVVDSSGAAVGDATVQVKNAGTGVLQTTNSDAQGRFTVPSLNVGDYEVQATKAGFGTSLLAGYRLHPPPAPDANRNRGRVALL